MKKIFQVVMALCVMVSIFPLRAIFAEGEKIDLKADQLSGYSDPSHPLSDAVDGNTSTYWKTISSNGYGADSSEQKETRMYDHNRYITIALDGVYDLDKIKIYNTAGTFNNYYIYASENGTDFDKIVSKTDNTLTPENGTSHSVRKRASYIRLNMAYNSGSYETNLAEIEVYGNKISDDVKKPKEISVSKWQGSSYQKEWDKFESDTSYANAKTIQEVRNLVGRVIGEKWVSSFRFELRDDMDGNDVFEIENGNKSIIIRGNDGVSLASGFNYYLKNYAQIDYNPLFESNTEMKDLKPIGKKIVKETQYDVRYALNFCTYSYTMAFWGWEEYQEFIDWAAMNGVNLMLDIVGQEEVIRQTLKQYNYTDEEIKDYIAGPGYFAWFYMQNLYSFGGPLPDKWFEQRVELGRKMHDRMQAFGINPVIQGFSGQVPLTFDDKNEGAVLTPIDEWPSFTRPAIIKTYLSDEEIAAGKKDYFKDMSVKFYDAQKNVFGDVSDYYAADPFHEGGDTSGLDVKDIFKTVQTQMLNSNKDAIWVLQQWQGNLNDGNLSGLVKPEQTLALDLQTDKNPSYSVMEKYNVPWVWNMLHNFGGRMGLDGEIDSIASRPASTYVDGSASGMVGIGITPEALENSPVVYELLFDMTWSSDPINPSKWLEKYAERRAGGTSDSLQEAWDTLHETAYSVKKEYFQGAAETVINARPGFNFSSASTWGHSLIPYDKTELDKALQLLIDNYDAFKDSPAYRYDLADVSEQVLCNAAIEYHGLMTTAYNNGDSAEFKRVSQHYLELIELSDKILGSNQEFMLGTWIEDARTMLDDADDWTKDLFEFNARALVTTWGGERSGSLKDYSNRKWAGLTSSFYKERWSMWISNRQAELDGTAKNPIAANAENNWFLWEWQWVNRKSDDGFSFTTTADYSDLKTQAQEALDSYSSTSLKDFGGAAETKVNIVEGKLFETNPDTDEDMRKNLSDGSTATEWRVNDDGEYVFTLDFNGTYEVDSVEILLQQLAKDFKYNYKVEIYDGTAGSWQEIGANANDDTMSSQTIITLDKDANKAADQIRITMKTRNADSDPLTIAEFKVMGKALHVQQVYNIAHGLLANSDHPTAGDSDITYLTDDDLGNLWKTVWGSTGSMYPATVTLDLKNTYDVTSVELYLEDINRPYKFKVVTVDENGAEATILDKSDTTETLSEKTYKIPVNASIKTVKVVFEGTTEKGPAGAASPALRELKVLSLSPQKETAESINHALNKPVTASSRNPYVNPEPKWINDGKADTVWSYNGTGNPDGYAEIDLQGMQFIEKINLLYNKENYEKYYKFDVYVYNESGTKTVIYSEDDETTPNKVSYEIEVNQNITKLGVDYKGKKAGTDGWFDIAELEAIGPKGIQPDVIFGSGNINGITTDEVYKNTIDKNTDTFAADIKDKEIVYQLGGEYYVDHAVFTFEKAELGLRYMVYSEDKDGNRTLVLDASGSNDVLADRAVEVNVKRTASKIIFKHLGNNGNGPAYLAEPRLYEAAFEMGTPENALNEATSDHPDAGALTDNDASTSYTMPAGSSIEFTLKKASDIGIVHLIPAVSSNPALFKVEAYDNTVNEWKTLYDGSANTQNLSEYITVLQKAVFTDRIRLSTLANALDISEFNVYALDMTQPLINYIAQVREQLEAKRYDDNNGSYMPEERAIVETALNAAEAKLLNGMSSADVQSETAVIKEALNNFLKHGIIYIDRTPLLSNINYGTIVLDTARNKNRSNDDNLNQLETKLQEAKTLYAQYDVTLTAINECNQELETMITTVYNDLDIDSRFEARKARAQALATTPVGDKHGQIETQADIDALHLAITTAETDFASGSVDQLTVIRTLDDAIRAFESKIVNVSKADLLRALQAMDGLQRGNYDIHTWNELQQAMDAAKTINETEAVSQADVNEAIAEVDKKKAALVLLDKANLRKILDHVSALKEDIYTAETWQNLMDVYVEANTLYMNDELTQELIDAMYVKLDNAEKSLTKKTVPPLTPESPDKPGNSGNGSNHTTGGNTEGNTGGKPSGAENETHGQGSTSNSISTGDTMKDYTALYVILTGISILLIVGISIKKRTARLAEK